MKFYIETKKISKIFEEGERGKELIAIDEFSLGIKPGEIVALVGRSGCGKTTLLKIMGGILTPTEGVITIGGKPASRTSLQKEVGFVFQKPALLPWRTVLENVLLPLEIMDKASPRKTNTEKAKEMLAKVGLLEFKDFQVQELSGGMQQRVSLARTLVFEPKVLLMDEPFSSLDEITRDAMDTMLLNLWQRKKPTIIFVTHSIREAVYLSDRVVVLSGRPSRVKRVIGIDFPRPRNEAIKFTAKFNRYMKKILSGLKD